VIPVIAYYPLAEFDEVKRAILGLVPRAYQSRVAEKAAVVDALLSGFIRGQLLVCLLLGLLYGAGFAAIGVDLGIGVAAGLRAIVPYVGALSRSRALPRFACSSTASTCTWRSSSAGISWSRASRDSCSPRGSWARASACIR
jgi:hypothetical protein